MLTRTEKAVVDHFLDEYDEEDNFQQVIFKVTNWDNSVVVKDDYDEFKRPELVSMMWDYRAGLEAAGVPDGPK
jgi:hypothetical protein